MIRYVLFDIDDTLLNFRDQAEPVIREALGELGMTFTDEDFAVYHRINGELWHELSAGTITREGVYAARWPRVLAALGREGDGAQIEALFHKKLTLCAVPEVGAAETLAYLSQRCTVCTASNAPQRQQEVRLEKAELSRYFTHVFTSEGVGVDKPARAFFERILAVLGNPDPAEVLMVGDTPEADINGAAVLGLRTCFINTRGIALPPDCHPDFCITTLPELKAIL
jgi:YjjG family noncanonical pyrimidine nucleotidase